ncbi:MAG: glycosyltransferase family 4 protein [Thermoplasmata archaeon]|nr:MAG: glycosyltransferase family 4 protein [Thermoplasmata archaeon]
MKILMVLSDNTFPPDIRVEKEARSLISSGHKVHLLVRGSSNQKKEEIVNNIHVHRFFVPTYDMPFLGYSTYFFIHRYKLTYRIIRTIRKYGIQALHVHDLPYGMAAAMAGKIYNLPVIFDMHEHYVDLMKSNFEVQGMNVPLLPSLLSYEERLVCSNAKKVVVVAEEGINRVAQQHKISKDKIVLVSNTADIQLLSRFEEDHKKHKHEKEKDDIILSYIGIFSKDRGIDVLLKAMPLILDKHENVKLLLVGVDPYVEELTDLIKDLGIQNKVKFTGWVPISKAMEYVIESDLCTVPHQSTPQRKTTLPHKIFQYMYFKKPVVVSDIPPLKRIVTEAKCGLVFKADDHTDCAQKVNEILDNPKILFEMGENGRKAVQRIYNWNEDAKKLLKLYEELSG